MRIAEIIGNVTLNKCHPAIQGGRLLLAVPLAVPGIVGAGGGRGEPLVLYDDRGAGTGSRVAVSEGTEAAAPFLPEQKPIDAYGAAILDRIEVHSS